MSSYQIKHKKTGLKQTKRCKKSRMVFDECINESTWTREDVIAWLI